MVQGFLEMETRVGEKDGNVGFDLGDQVKKHGAFSAEGSGHGDVRAEFPDGPADDILRGLGFEANDTLR